MWISRHNYFSASVNDLRCLVENNRTNHQLVCDVLEELRFRFTDAAHVLKKELEGDLFVKPQSEKSQPYSFPVLSKDPRNKKITCIRCGCVMRIQLFHGSCRGQCLSCRAAYHAFDTGEVLEVGWQVQPVGELPMEVSVACEILGLAMQHSLADIKLAWRKAAQDYHPDKHRTLPERLRRAANLEMQRINAAGRFLEAIQK